MKYLVLSTQDPIVGSWNLPTFWRGAEKDSIDALKENIERANVGGHVKQEEDGLVCYATGIFDDAIGKIVCFEVPILLGTLRAPVKEVKA